jgi:hypothetical protein
VATVLRGAAHSEMPNLEEPAGFSPFWVGASV